MPTDIGRDEVRRLAGVGVPLVEVLPEEEYRQQHLPRAISVPLGRLDRLEAARFDPTQPIVVYCHDNQ